MSETFWDGIPMLWRKKKDNVYGDFTTSRLLGNGIYSVNEPDFEEGGGFLNLRERPVLVGIWYVFILSCLLWWLPLFGPMIAGYIGGRKAGSPLKGIMVAIIPVFIILLLLIGIDVGLIPGLGAVVAIPSMLMSGIQSISPTGASYLSGMYDSLGGVVGVNGNGFFIVVIFGYIGGMMADINRKDLAHATGNKHFYDGFANKFSGWHIGKFADMVAERVLWSLGTVSYAGKNIIARTHSEPDTFSFENLKSLPASTHSEPYQYESRADSYESERAFGYDDYQPLDYEPLPPNDIRDVDSFENYEPIIPEREYQESEWSVTHRDLSEDSMINSWKEHDRNVGKGPNKQRSERNSNKSSPKRSSKTKTKEKRDAVIFDSKEKNSDKDRPKKKNTPVKRKQLPLVTRALAAVDEIKVKKDDEEEQEEPLLSEVTEVSKPQRAKQAQSYERL